jgi:hypothetical protein
MTTFNSKETYLAYRSNWKATYKTLGQDIRIIKNDIKETQRAKGYAGSMQYEFLKMRKKATAMIEELKLAKVEAQRQYLAAHSEELVLA